MPPNAQPGGPVVVLHGLFGSKQNWRSLMKLLGHSLKRRVYTVDLRNHGVSPQSPRMDYEIMAADVVQFFIEHRLKNDITLIGHSMGGKVAMATALSPLLEKNLPKALSTLIIVDIAPGIGKISDEFASYVDAMQDVQDADVKTKREADVVLEKWEKDISIRQFLLTNLVADKHGSHFRIPLSHLRANLDQIGKFPYPPDGTHTWEGRTLFVKGERSKYINRRNLGLCFDYFPNARLETMDTGHWVHAERPQEFVDLVTRFVHGEDPSWMSEQEAEEALATEGRKDVSAVDTTTEPPQQPAAQSEAAVNEAPESAEGPEQRATGA
ncbi:alpha/beta-hydrolase [Dacryopinax primogenitus]|uniref:Alpha/beta-hydrolase n=1 Tax=Dacryopinax primogenitus (strain DJM 731) TaxID=1858805 RepID=M5GDN0_DACPD|nr:alpha/beta-hydrolase [Dacryopinax primogenitus]EJU04657.1 alpha/beta-hydrolase [Dacryopinax primogenitus]